MREEQVKGQVWGWRVHPSQGFISSPDERCWKLELNIVLKTWGLMEKYFILGSIILGLSLVICKTAIITDVTSRFAVGIK